MKYVRGDLGGNLGEEGWREFATAGGLLFGAQHGGRDDDDNENAADDDVRALAGFIRG